MPVIGESDSVADLVCAANAIADCCLSLNGEHFAPVRVVAHYTSGLETDRNGMAIFENADGRVGVIEDSEDYTGHG